MLITTRYAHGVNNTDDCACFGVQIQAPRWEAITIVAADQLKTTLMDKKMRDTTILLVEIMISKRQVKGKLVTWYKFAFAV